MHIGLFSPAWPVNEYPSGIVTYIHYLRAGLIEQGHRVSIFSKVIGRTNRDSDVYLVEPTLRYRFRRKLAALARQQSYDIFNWGKAIADTVNRVSRVDPVDVFEMEESFGWCADVQAGISCPVVVKLHGPAFLTLVEEDRKSAFAEQKMDREGRALGRMACITAPAKCTLQSTIAQYQLAPKVQQVIRNPIKAEPESNRWHLDLCDRRTILFVGRFDKPKGGDIVLAAFRRLIETDERLKLVFVGPNWGLTTANGKRVYFEEFRDSLFSALQVPSITYLGEVPRADIAALRKKCMLTIVASRWENQPNTALEAMIQGCPIVAIDTGGVGEIIQDHETGLLAQPDDIEDFCRKVLCLMNDEALAKRMGEHASRIVAERHSVEVITRETIDVYQRAISTGAR